MRLYDELADWWPLVSPPSEYVEEASEYLRLLRAFETRRVETMLELGSGGGNNASHLKRDLRMTLVEPSDGMRAHSVALNPECEHLPGDMRTVRLGRTFDAVFIHDAIEYMTTEEDLRAALLTAAEHVVPGGVVLVAPDATRETFEPGLTTEGGDEPEAPGRGFRSLRYLMWTLPPKPGESFVETHFGMLLKERDGTVRSLHDVHRNGLHSRATWLRLFDEVGLDARVEVRTLEGTAYDTFVAVKRASPG
ncbi:hypothetical protein MFUL124B02_13370 [Myxococcus fulvus 124B02]|nr:hypothetical protein MFUL124B02_13370 [Myxococcus fulvus 124B02]